jgi:hypothetical protein
MNPLLDYLAARGHIGRANAAKRRDVAEALGVSIREVREYAEAARNAGKFVGYSTASAAGGLFLAANDAERLELIGQIRETCLNRLRQYSALKRALANQYQRTLFPETPDQVFRRGSRFGT